MVDWVPFYLGECSHGASVQRGLALLDRVLLLRKIHLEGFGIHLQEEHSSNAKPTRADQMFGWLVPPDPGHYHLGPGGADQLFMAWMFPGGGLGCLSCMR